MIKKYEKCTIHSVDYKSHSTLGNPSYWVCFSDSEGNFHRGYTASNAMDGYAVRNNKQNDQVYIKYHFTKKGACVIDYVRDID